MSLPLFGWKSWRKKKLLREWGTKNSAYKSILEAERLFALKSKNPREGLIDEQTWSDLDLTQIFEEIDECISPIGRQYLYDVLRGGSKMGRGLSSTWRAIHYFNENPQSRTRLQLLLMKLRSERTVNIADALYDHETRVNVAPLALLFISLFVPVCLLFSLFHHALIWPAFAGVIFNICLGFGLSRKIDRRSSGFSQLSKLIGVAKQIEREIEAIKPLQPKTSTEIRPPSQLVYSLSGFDSTSSSIFTAMTAHLMNMLFLFDVVSFNFFVARVQRDRGDLIQVFELVGELDSKLSLASFKNRIPTCCEAELSKAREIQLCGIYHPLVPNAVPNDFDSGGVSHLITGSNMAGKTTFLKSIGINVLFGQNLGFCLANHAKVPSIHVLSSIEPRQSLDGGTSSYGAEIDRLVEIRRTIESGNYIVLIDEIMKGTNTVERISAAAAVLDSIAEHATLVVTTHDIELADVTQSRFEMVHFSETGNPEHMFDYVLKKGVNRKRNAIKLLEHVGFPKSTIEQSKKNVQIVEKLYPTEYGDKS